MTGDIVVMTRTPWQFTQATGIPSVQIPVASRADILAKRNAGASRTSKGLASQRS